MMYYFTENGDGRKISLERAYVVSDINGHILGYGGSVATAIMSADDLNYDTACALERVILGVYEDE